MRWLWLIVPCGSLALVGLWFRRRWLNQETVRINGLIVPLDKKHYRFTGHDENLQQRTTARRREADGIRSRAAKVESGAHTSDLLRRVYR